jgi:galactan 5-O-arabinofuranosyltransferase
MQAESTDRDLDWRRFCAEAAVSILTMTLFLVSCIFIRVDPLDRIGQISGLAHLGLRFVLCTTAILVPLAISRRVRDGRRDAIATGLACAAIAGLVGGMLGGGLIVALRGSPYGINAMGGDMGALARWANDLLNGKPLPALYPPLSLHILARYSQVTGLSPEYAIKHMQIFGTAAFGPVSYLVWRTRFSPTWALGVGAITMLPLIEPYKAYPSLVLVVFIPLTLNYLDSLRDVASLKGRRLYIKPVLYGIAFGLLCLFYSGWFQWSAPGMLIVGLATIPWKTARKPALIFLALTGVAFGIVISKYALGLIGPAGKVVDNYIYFDTKTDPAYIAIWRNDTPGDVGMWPPLGELGGVGLYSILLAVGFAFAVALGKKTIELRTFIALMVGAWIMRFSLARKMWETKLVQLYPRTTPLILYCLLLLGAYALYWWYERSKEDSWLRDRATKIGALCAIAFVLGSAGSAISDRWMPLNSDPPGPGWLTWNSQQAKRALKQRVYKPRPLTWIRKADP